VLQSIPPLEGCTAFTRCLKLVDLELFGRAVLEIGRLGVESARRTVGTMSTCPEGKIERQAR
jgi:hypothetical protein